SARGRRIARTCGALVRGSFSRRLGVRLECALRTPLRRSPCIAAPVTPRLRPECLSPRPSLRKGARFPVDARAHGPHDLLRLLGPAMCRLGSPLPSGASSLVRDRRGETQRKPVTQERARTLLDLPFGARTPALSGYARASALADEGRRLDPPLLSHLAGEKRDQCRGDVHPGGGIARDP